MYVDPRGTGNFNSIIDLCNIRPVDGPAGLRYLLCKSSLSDSYPDLTVDNLSDAYNGMF